MRLFIYFLKKTQQILPLYPCLFRGRNLCGTNLMHIKRLVPEYLLHQRLTALLKLYQHCNSEDKEHQ